MTFCRGGRILRPLEASAANAKQRWANSRNARRHSSPLAKPTKKENETMTKSLEVISEAVRSPKHPFSKLDNHPKKPLKHRYERRKIKEYLHIGEWVPGEATQVTT